MQIKSPSTSVLCSAIRAAAGARLLRLNQSPVHIINSELQSQRKQMISKLYNASQEPVSIQLRIYSNTMSLIFRYNIYLRHVIALCTVRVDNLPIVQK